MLEKLFNKTNPESKVTKEKNTLKGVAALRIIAKETLLFPSLAKELRSLNNAFSQYVKLHNIRPVVPGPISDIKKSLAQSKEIKVATIKVAKYGKEKKRTFLSGVFDFLMSAIKGVLVGTLLSIGYLVYKITEIITPYVENFISKVKDGISLVSNEIQSFYEQTDWLNLFVTSFEKYFSFLSFGLISEEQVADYIGQAGSFYKQFIAGIGRFLQIALEWLAPRLQKVGRSFATNILGVDVDKLIERRAVKEELEKNAKRLQDEYDVLKNQASGLNFIKTSLESKKSKLLDKQQKKTEEKVQPEPKVEKEKKKSFFGKLFEKEEKKLAPIEEKKLAPIEERSITLPPIEERSIGAPAPAPAPKAIAEKSQKTVPAPTAKPLATPSLEPTPSKVPTAEKQEEENKTEGSGDMGMKYSEGSNVVKIISKYGMRQLPSENQPRLHGGIDYAASHGTPIRFLGSSAKVMDASVHNGYGRVVDIATNGEILRFAHLSKMLVKPGDIIEKGQTIGLVGGSGAKQGKVDEGAYGPHLHFEHRSKPTYVGTDTYDPVKSGATRMISFGNKIAATDYSVTEQYANFKGEYEKGLGTESSKLALAYRQQSKPQNPVYVDARTINNVVVETKKNKLQQPA